MSGGHVDADSPEAGAVLEAMVGLVRGEGGSLAPGTVVVERDGQLRVEHRAGDRPDPLIEVPRHLLVPIGPDPLIGPQRDLGALFDALFEATGKQRWYDTEHPRGALPADSALVAAIRRVRPSWRVVPGREGLLRSRLLQVSGEGGVAHVLMPLVDAMNHHSAAPSYRVDVALSVGAWQEVGSNECFVRYHRHSEPLAMAVNYGFVDATGGGAMSAPVRVDVEGLGLLEIGSAMVPGGDVRGLPRVESTPQGVRLSHLWLERGAATRAVVGLAVAARAKVGVASNAARRAGDLAWTGLLEANAALLDDLAATARAHGGAAAAVVAGGAEEQARLLRSLG